MEFFATLWFEVRCRRNGIGYASWYAAPAESSSCSTVAQSCIELAAADGGQFSSLSLVNLIGLMVLRSPDGRPAKTLPL